MILTKLVKVLRLLKKVNSSYSCDGGGAGLADEQSEEGRSAKPRGRGLGRSN